MITPKDVGKQVVIVGGIYAGVAGILTFYMSNLNGSDYVEVTVPGDSRYIVPAGRVALCDDSERAAVDEALREEQRKRGLR